MKLIKIKNKEYCVPSWVIRVIARKIDYLLRISDDVKKLVFNPQFQNQSLVFKDKFNDLMADKLEFYTSGKKTLLKLNVQGWEATTS